jgi:DNA-binding CsgD family transcriptional regulator
MTPGPFGRPKPVTIMHEPGGELATLRFVHALLASVTLEQLERAFIAGLPRVLDAPMYGIELGERSASANLSEAFIASYDREARAVDPVLARAMATGEPAYNRAMMSVDEWEASAAYRRAYRMHRVGHVVQAPLSGGRIYIAASDHGFDPEEIALVGGIAGVLSDTIAGIAQRERLESARTALELAGTAVVTSEPELRLNDAAQRLLADVLDAEAHVHHLLAPPAHSRRVDVQLITGEAGVLHAHVARHGITTAVLELEREQPMIAPGPLAALTAREIEVARLVVDGLADREIAERLYLSPHTVSQHLKRVYRKLEVDSRVALTRLLLT